MGEGGYAAREPGRREGSVAMATHLLAILATGHFGHFGHFGWIGHFGQFGQSGAGLGCEFVGVLWFVLST